MMLGVAPRPLFAPEPAVLPVDPVPAEPVVLPVDRAEPEPSQFGPATSGELPMTFAAGPGEISVPPDEMRGIGTLGLGAPGAIGTPPGPIAGAALKAEPAGADPPLGATAAPAAAPPVWAAAEIAEEIRKAAVKAVRTLDFLSHWKPPLQNCPLGQRRQPAAGSPQTASGCNVRLQNAASAARHTGALFGYCRRTSTDDFA